MSNLHTRRTGLARQPDNSPNQFNEENGTLVLPLPTSYRSTQPQERHQRSK